MRTISAWTLRAAAVIALPLAASLAAGQDSATATSPAATDTVHWAIGARYSDELLVQGRVLRVLVVDSVVIGAMMLSNDKPAPIDIEILNASGRRFNVLPDSCSLEVIDPVVKPLAYISAEKIAKHIQNAARWAMIGEALAGMGRSIGGTSTSTTSASAYGSNGYAYGTATTTTHDEAANQAITSAHIATIEQSAEQEKVRKLTGALLATTVMPGQSVGGIVYFEREKKAKWVLLRVRLEGRILELTLPVPPR